ncbi:MAG: hypothetical protein ACE5H3_03085 [Planctomycetota bacterium]
MKAEPDAPRAGAWTLPAAAVLLLVVLANAWVADDAMITLRTADNFVHGLGLRWNPVERVQTYTNPLWLFWLTPFYAVTREPFFTTIFVGLLTSALAVLWLLRGAGAGRWTALCLFVLLWSKSFVDYAASGLENPMTFLLLAAGAAILSKGTGDPKRLRTLAFVTALAALNRMDTVLLFGPLLAADFLRNRKNPGPALRAVLTGLLPFLIWEAFSLFYYGFPFPNTAYAKPGTGTPLGERLAQGGAYLLTSLRHDPLTLLGIAGGLGLTLFGPARRLRPLGAGILLYCVYVLWIGGGFMSGRFLAAPFFAAVLVLSRLRVSWGGRSFAAAALGVAALGWAGGSPTVLAACTESSDDPAIDHGSGIFDERLYYCRWVGLRSVLFEGHAPGTPDGERGLEQKELGGTRLQAAIGWFAFQAGPGVYVHDLYGLADPLLARLPARRDLVQRVGHFVRAMPAGYPETLASGENRIQDETLRRLWDDLALVTRGPLFAPGRFAAILRLNLGAALPPETLRALRRPHRLRLHPASIPKLPPGPGSSPVQVAIPAAGAEIPLVPPAHEAIEIGVSGNDGWFFYLVGHDGRLLGIDQLFPASASSGAPVPHRIELPARARKPGAAALLVFPYEGDDDFFLSWLRILP